MRRWIVAMTKMAAMALLASCATTPAVAPSAVQPSAASAAATPADAKPPATRALRISGYYAGSDVYEARNYPVSAIPAELLTHVFYCFLKIDSNYTLVSYDPNANTVMKNRNDPPNLKYRGNFAQLQLLRKRNRALKVIVSVGGGNLSSNFSTMAASGATRKVFADSCLAFLRKYNFDGLDIDWEFPVEGGQANVVHSPDDTKNLSLLLQELRKTLDASALTDGKSYELGLTVSPNPTFAQHIDVAACARSVDFLNIMTYDFHGNWDNAAYHVAPLFPSTNDPGNRWENSRKMNVRDAVDCYLLRGMPARKVNIGIPLYGVGWRIAKGLKKPLYAPTVDPSRSEEIGTLDYASVQQMIARGLHPSWDVISHAPFIYNPATGLFVSYDDGRSVTEKVDFVVQKGLGGVFFWELSSDRGGDLMNFTWWAIGRARAEDGLAP